MNTATPSQAQDRAAGPGDASATPDLRTRLQPWISFSGRMGTAQFFRHCLVAAPFGAVAGFAARNDAALILVAAAFVPYALLVVSAAARRLQDFGLSGWWYLLVVFVMVGEGHVLPEAAPWPVVRHALVAGVATFLLLGLIRGMRGENRFGPDPVQDAAEAPAAAPAAPAAPPVVPRVTAPAPAPAAAVAAPEPAPVVAEMAPEPAPATAAETAPTAEPAPTPEPTSELEGEPQAPRAAGSSRKRKRTPPSPT
jgi:uncharacterized membrane protein YhaH (DUF805 family)